MRRTNEALVWLGAGWLACTAALSRPADPPPVVPQSQESREMLRWVQQSADAAGRPFVIVDKKNAKMHVFDRSGRVIAATPVLLGSAPGDHTVPGVGQRAQTGTLAAHER